VLIFKTGALTLFVWCVVILKSFKKNQFLLVSTGKGSFKLKVTPLLSSPAMFCLCDQQPIQVSRKLAAALAHSCKALLAHQRLTCNWSPSPLTGKVEGEFIKAPFSQT